MGVDDDDDDDDVDDDVEDDGKEEEEGRDKVGKPRRTFIRILSLRAVICINRLDACPLALEENLRPKMKKRFNKLIWSPMGVVVVVELVGMRGSTQGREEKGGDERERTDEELSEVGRSNDVDGRAFPTMSRCARSTSSKQGNGSRVKLQERAARKNKMFGSSIPKDKSEGRVGDGELRKGEMEWNGIDGSNK
jgi:hypothetical protein